ncbi:hypothetical protein [Corynebacterium mayonis]|uniref:hypothetical protein n=1 Tax=Corynebacterium mayonis TaxID=3062461 RepID=UPI003140A68B
MTTPKDGGTGYPDDGEYFSQNYSPQPQGFSSYGGDEYAQEAGLYDVNASQHGALRYHGTTLVDGTYGDGHDPHPLNDPASNGWTHRRGTGKLDVMAAWSFGFKAVFANPMVWLLTGLAILLISGVSGLLPLAGLVSLFLYPLLCSMALMGTLAKRFEFGQVSAPRYGATLGTIVVLAVLALIVSVILLLLLLTLPFVAEPLRDVTAMNTDPEDIETLLPIFGAAFKVLGVVTLVMLLISPFLYLSPFFAADNAAGVGGALKMGFAAAVRNYPQLLLFTVISFVVTLLGTLALVAGLIVATPVCILASAHAYRQISGGPVPSED